MIAVAHMSTMMMPNVAVLASGQAGPLGAQDFRAALGARLGLPEGAFGGAGKSATQVDRSEVKVGKDSVSDKAAKGHTSAAKGSTKSDAAEDAETEMVATGAAVAANTVQSAVMVTNVSAVSVEGADAVAVAGADEAAGPSLKTALARQTVGAKVPDTAANVAVAETANAMRAVAPVVGAGLPAASSEHSDHTEHTEEKLAGLATLIVGPATTVLSPATQPLVGHAQAVKTEGQALVSHAHEVAARPEQAHVYEASTGALEVGVLTGAHGWLRVRAEMDGGGAVSAQVVAANAGAAETLHKELPAISAYLANEQVGVSSLVVNAMEAGAGAGDAALGANAGSGAGAGAGAGAASGEAGSGGDGARQFRPETCFAGDSFYERLPIGFGAVSMPAALYGAGMNGGWLSVRV